MGRSYLQFLEEVITTAIVIAIENNAISYNTSFQQDEVPPHFHFPVREYLGISPLVVLGVEKLLNSHRDPQTSLPMKSLPSKFLKKFNSPITEKKNYSIFFRRNAC